MWRVSFTLCAPLWALLRHGDVVDLRLGDHGAAGLLKVFAVLESDHPPVHDAGVRRVQGHDALRGKQTLQTSGRTDRQTSSPELRREPLDGCSHPAERLSLADAFGVDDAQVADVVLQAALVQGLQPGYLLLLHGHDELPSKGEKTVTSVAVKKRED